MFDTLGQGIGADRFDTGKIDLAVLIGREMIGKFDGGNGPVNGSGERFGGLIGGTVGIGVIETVAGIDEGRNNFTDTDGTCWSSDFPVDTDRIAAGYEGRDINNLVTDKAFLNGGRKGVAGGIAGKIGSSGGGIGVKDRAGKVVVVLAVEFGVETGGI